MILLADSGSTKTDWLLAGSGEVRFQSSGLNPFYQTKEAIEHILSKEVLPQLASAPVRRIYFYGAGCADEASSKPIKEALLMAFPPAELIEVNSDLLAAARGLCGYEAGIACILGTGSNNCLYNGKNIVHNIGSLGFWLGDEGSGGYLGKQLVVRYLHNELPIELHQEFAKAYPDVSRLMILNHAYKQPFPNRFFAGFAPFLSQHVSHQAVHNLVETAFGDFLAMYVCKHADAYSLPVHFTGSVAFHFQSILTKVLISKGLHPGIIEKSPMPGLLRYHVR